jgi:hypothetical protein
VTSGQPDTVQQLVVTAENTFTKATGGDLAYTGFAGVGVGALGVTFIAVGAWLVRRRRA